MTSVQGIILVESSLKTCVQCKATYAEDLADLGEGHCAFHRSNFQSRGKHSCCGQSEPCVRGSHRSKHHCDYPYDAFFSFVQAIVNYCNTTDPWAEVSLTDPETGQAEAASAGQLLRWDSHGDNLSSEHLLFVKVGSSFCHSSPCFFQVFSQADLDAIPLSSSPSSDRPLLFSSSPDGPSRSAARWIVEDRRVVGISLSCQVPSFPSPSVAEIRFSRDPLASAGVSHVSRGGIVERRHKGAPHPLPPVAHNVAAFPDLSAVSVPAPRGDFPTLDRVSGTGAVVVTAKPLLCNQHRTTEGFDAFDFDLSLFNASPSDTFVLVRARIEYKLRGDAEWQAAAEDEPDRLKLQSDPLPLPLQPFQKIAYRGSVMIPFGVATRPDWYRSYTARYRPLRLRFTFYDPAQRQVSQIQEYVQKIPKLEGIPQDNGQTQLVLHYDDVDKIERVTASIRQEPQGQETLLQGCCTLTVELARKLVHTANQTGKTELPLECSSSSEKSLACFALVDKACQCVYAVKLALVSPKGVGQVGYLPVPFYGAPDADVVEGTPAVEEYQLPSIENFVNPCQVFSFDDPGLDDPVQEPPQGTSQPAAQDAPAGSVVVNQELRRIGDQLERLGNLFESLITILRPA